MKKLEELKKYCIKKEISIVKAGKVQPLPQDPCYGCTLVCTVNCPLLIQN